MILLAGGTKDSRIIAEKLLESGSDILVTTATEYGKQLISTLDLETRVARLDLNGLIKLAEENRVIKIVDVTHPYAVEISKNLMSLSRLLKIPYFRYERPMINYKKDLGFYTLEPLIDYLEGLDGNILLTLGSNNVARFKNLNNKKNFYIRVLPTKYAIEKCETAGFKPSQIIGLQGPFSEVFNISIYENYDIKYLITKESGRTGGELEKVEAANKLGIEVVVLKRPDIEYINLFEEIEELVASVLDSQT